MATHLDLQEQEQIDELKAFWKQYGNLITWVVTLVLAAFAAWNGWNWWQREQAIKASALYDELEKAAAASDAAKVKQAFNDMKDRFASTVVTGQAGLMTAKTLADRQQPEEALSVLLWLAESAKDEGHRALARLRAAALLLDKKSYDEALKQLDGITQPDFVALTQDRRGDVLKAQGKTAEAVKAWTAAWSAMPDSVEYRRVIKAKLAAHGAEPEVVVTTVKAAS